MSRTEGDSNESQVQYTVGNLLTRLAMIESSTTTQIIESHPPPAYSEEPDAPLEKKPIIDNADVEIVTIKHRPITSSVKDSIRHLYRVGGFRARWRGFRESIVYNLLVNLVGHGFATILFRSAEPHVGRGLGFMMAVLILCRFRMVWTHAMIAAPTSKPWYRRYCSRKNSRVLLLPTLIYELSAIATFLVPISTWYAVGAFEYADPQVLKHFDRSQLAGAAWRALAGPSMFLLIVTFFTIPANTTLARIEACLLPQDDQIIVPFDRESILGDLDLTAKGAPGKLFASAWKSITFSTRARVMLLYVKMVTIQVSAFLICAMMAFGILFVTGPDQITMFAYVASP